MTKCLMSSKIWFALVLFECAVLSCSSENKETDHSNIRSNGRTIDYKHPDKDVVVKKRKEAKGDRMLMFMIERNKLKRPVSDQHIKQLIVFLTTDMSRTEPGELKLMLMTGVLFEDIGNHVKAKEYYQLEVDFADRILATGKHASYLQSKVEALILLNDLEKLKSFEKHCRKTLS